MRIATRGERYRQVRWDSYAATPLPPWRAAPGHLSAAALQVLAVVAYEQPVTRADISRIRGVDSDGVVASLIRQGLIAEDRSFAVRGVSQPLSTTAEFLRRFGLSSLAELPAPATCNN
jgi:segregation and condensation protein B